MYDINREDEKMYQIAVKTSDAAKDFEIEFRSAVQLFLRHTENKNDFSSFTIDFDFDCNKIKNIKIKTKGKVVDAFYGTVDNFTLLDTSKSIVYSNYLCNYIKYT